MAGLCWRCGRKPAPLVRISSCAATPCRIQSPVSPTRPIAIGSPAAPRRKPATNSSRIALCPWRRVRVAKRHATRVVTCRPARSSASSRARASHGIGRSSARSARRIRPPWPRQRPHAMRCLPAGGLSGIEEPDDEAWYVVVGERTVLETSSFRHLSYGRSRPMVHVNYLAVVVAAVAAFLLGWLWYSPLLFLKPWMRLRGLDPAAALAGAKMPVGKLVVELARC